MKSKEALNFIQIMRLFETTLNEKGKSRLD